MLELSRQLSDFKPAAGLLKVEYEDFVVEEQPLYPADGVGTHTYFLLEKAGLSTQQAIHDLARALNVRRHEIGVAGLKDARAVTRQWMSIEHVEPEKIAAVDLPRMRVLETTRHTNKLRIGHLKGNHFVIKIRQSEPDRLAELQDALAVLSRRGVPNYFGAQRFGYRGDTWAVGQAIVRGDIDEAMDHILGRPSDKDYGEIRRARELYERGKYTEAARAWPRMFRTEHRALKALGQSGGKHRRGFATIDKTTRIFYVSAYQSYLFNQVVSARLATGLGNLLNGDLAWLHASGAVFHVEDAALEQPRADNFDISPSGPLFGYRMTQPTEEPGRQEAELLTGEGLTTDTFRSGTLRVKGSRRPLRFSLGDAQLALGADRRGEYLELQFALPRGCYATTLLHELFHLEPATGADDDQETEARIS
ncbi:MAG: tRNA pseudouridine(13) synthase TruD [Phycisphaerae bacterium]|nr:tRNA pseudouridine(13) synthase TruD [Phycisphaerae bacterium]